MEGRGEHNIIPNLTISPRSSFRRRREIIGASFLAPTVNDVCAAREVKGDEYKILMYVFNASEGPPGAVRSGPHDDVIAKMQVTSPSHTSPPSLTLPIGHFSHSHFLLQRDARMGYGGTLSSSVNNANGQFEVRLDPVYQDMLNDEVSASGHTCLCMCVCVYVCMCV